MRVWIALYAGLVAAVIGVAVVHARTDDPGRGPVNPGLARKLEATGMTLYLPELRDYEPRKPKVKRGSVSIDYKRGRYYAFTLVLAPSAEVRDLCDFAHDPADECRATDDLMDFSFEEMSYVGVVRGDTALVFQGLVTEADRDLDEDAIRALLRAPEVSPRELARLR